MMLNQVVKLEDNSKLVQDQAVKQENRKELRYLFDVLVRNMETQTVEWTTIFTAKTEPT